MCSGRRFVVVAKNLSFVAISNEWGMREERAGAQWAAPAWPPLLRNPYNGLRAGGWLFTASNASHVEGAARETETLFGSKRRRFGQEGNGRSSIETEGALFGIIKF
jgi:hypothetical protein